MVNKEKIKELKEKLIRFNEAIRLTGNSITKKEIDEKKEEIAKLIIKLLKWEFSLRIEYFIKTEKHSKIFKFLAEKKRTARIYEGSVCLPGVEAPKMDKDFFMKYIKELFPLLSDNIEFEDKEIKILIDYDGGLWIEEK